MKKRNVMVLIISLALIVMPFIAVFAQAFHGPERAVGKMIASINNMDMRGISDCIAGDSGDIYMAAFVLDSIYTKGELKEYIELLPVDLQDFQGDITEIKLIGLWETDGDETGLKTVTAFLEMISVDGLGVLQSSCIAVDFDCIEDPGGKWKIQM